MVSLFEILKKKENELKSIPMMSHNDHSSYVQEGNIIVQEDNKDNDLSFIDSITSSSNNIIKKTSRSQGDKDEEVEDMKMYDGEKEDCSQQCIIDNIQYSKQNIILKQQQQQQHSNNNNNKSKDKRKQQQRIEFTFFDTKLPKLTTITLDDLIWTIYPTERINIFGNTLFCGRIIRSVECQRIPYILPPYPTLTDAFEIVEIFCGLNRFIRYKHMI
jgi:hypothetical protein